MQKKFDIPREIMSRGELLQPGILSCQGCGAALAMKLAMMGLGKRTIVVIPACCWTIILGVYPYSALQVPVIHVPFETAAVVASGVRAALDMRGEKDVEVMAWAGDGGTFDIGLQAHMNTGIQRSSATPIGAWTTTTPAGSLKKEPKKDLEKIMMGHSIPYLATLSVAYPDDAVKKFRRARTIRGTKFLHILSPCPPGWRIDPSQSIRTARLATLSNVFPLYEVVDGKLELSLIPEKTVPVKEYLECQGRFKGITPEMEDLLQRNVDRKWEELLAEAEKERQALS